ncbi:MAG: MoaD/ThiS family protein [Chloroflexi bacterium]|nr:MoaD/ThiS family protein [Chloroflexota bacterium]
MAKVKVEVFPWLSGTFGSRRSDRLVFEEDVASGATMGLLLRKLAADHKEFDEITFDRETRDLSGHISVILNGRLLELAGGLEAELKEGDSVLLLPAFDGGAAGFPVCGRQTGP